MRVCLMVALTVGDLAIIKTEAAVVDVTDARCGDQLSLVGGHVQHEGLVGGCGKRFSHVKG